MSGFLCSMVGATFAAAGRTAKTITANANAQVDTAQSKFGGASALFDGTGDYLSAPATISFGTGNFTWEAWVRLANDNTDMNLFDGSANGDISIRRTNDGKLQLGRFFVAFDTASTAMTIANTWTHLAVSRSGSTVKLFKDGVDITSTGGTNTNSLGISSTIYIGDHPGYSIGVNGHMDEIRVSDIARYTTTFTPSTTPFVNDANTLLLIHADGTDASTVFTDDIAPVSFPPTAAFFDDDATKLLLHFNGTNGATSTTDDNASGRTAKTITMTNSSLSTTQQKFGTASLRVDGTGGDYVSIPDSDDWDLQAAPRTFEAWVYLNSLTNVSRGSTGTAIPALFGHMNQGGTDWWAFGPNEAGGLTLYYWSGAANYVNSTLTNLTTGVWYHFALITTAAGAKGYVNGVEYFSTTLSNTPVKGNTEFSIGAEFGQSMNAYIDEVRVSHVNRYT